MLLKKKKEGGALDYRYSDLNDLKSLQIHYTLGFLSFSLSRVIWVNIVTYLEQRRKILVDVIKIYLMHVRISKVVHFQSILKILHLTLTL